MKIVKQNEFAIEKYFSTQKYTRKYKQLNLESYRFLKIKDGICLYYRKIGPAAIYNDSGLISLYWFAGTGEKAISEENYWNH